MSVHLLLEIQAARRLKMVVMTLAVGILVGGIKSKNKMNGAVAIGQSREVYGQILVWDNRLPSQSNT